MFGSPIPFGQPSNTSPFGSQTQSPFGQPSSNNPFGSQTQSPFGQPSSNNPFGQTNNANTNPFGAPKGTSMFGNNSTGASTGAFGQPQTQATSATGFSGLFGNTTQPSQFGNNGFATSKPFGASTTPTLNSTSSPFGNHMFGSGSAFSASSNPAFGPSAFSASSCAFGPGPSSSSSFNFGSSPAFAQSPSPFSSTPSIFNVQPAQVPSTGSRVTPYVPNTTEDPAEKLQSISGMNVYKGKSHEELKFEDYQKGDKGGPSTMFGQPQPFANPANPFANSAATNPFSQTPATPFSQTTTTNPFGPSLFGPSTTRNAFAPSTNPAFPSFPSTNPNPFASSGGSFTTTPSSSNPPAFPSFPSTTTNHFASSSNPGFPSFPSTTTSPFASPGSSFTSTFASPSTSFPTTPSPSLFPPSSNSAFNFSQSAFSSAPTNVSTPAFSTGFNFNNSQSPSLFNSNPSTGQNTNPGFSFNTASTGMGSLFSTTSSSTTSTTPFTQNPLNLSQQQPQQVANPTSFSNGMGSFSQVPASTNSVITQQQVPVTNPFGTLPALPQISFDQGRSSPSFQYGISSRPVVDTPASIRVSPLLTSRNILQRRVGAPLRKYRPGDDATPKVPFFNDEEYSKSFHYFIPRENPRALLIRPIEKENLAPLQENDKSLNKETNPEKKSDGEIGEAPLEQNVKHENHKNSSPSNAEIESLMPKLHHAEYYTEPRIQELAAKERDDPGYCGRVKDFVVGRNGYGNIKFLGETDVRKLELETMVQFNNREVLVYMDESTKPLVGEGLNKPAEVTLLNIKCYEKKSGKQVKEGSRVDKYKELLKRKGQEQGAEFVSYEAVNGEWKFRVQHF